MYEDGQEEEEGKQIWTEEQAAPLLPPEQSVNSDEYMVYGGAPQYKPLSPQSQISGVVKKVTYICS